MPRADVVCVARSRGTDGDPSRFHGRSDSIRREPRGVHRQGNPTSLDPAGNAPDTGWPAYQTILQPGDARGHPVATRVIARALEERGLLPGGSIASGRAAAAAQPPGVGS